MSKRELIRVAAWLPAVLVLGFAVLRSTGAEAGYPFYPLLAFTPYAVLFGALAVAWAAALRQRWAACMALAGTLVLLALVVPRFLPGDGEASAVPADPIRVMTFNLAIGRADTDQLADLAVAQSVDLIALQELTPAAAAALEAGPLGEEMPFAIVDPRDGSGGIGLISRAPLEELPRPEGLSSGQPVAVAVAPAEGAPASMVEVWSIHPPPPTSGANVDDLGRYLDAIPAADPDGPPRLLLGDFNSTLDHPDFRDMLQRGYRDAADALGEGLAATWPTSGLLPGVAIDHALGDGRIEFSDLSVHEIDGSDHKAVIVSVSFPPS